MRKLVLLLASLALGACATPQYKPSFISTNPLQTASWQKHKQVIAVHQNDWRFVGRFGASTSDDAWSGSIWWQQHDDTYRIELAGPLNQGTIRLQGDKDRSELLLAEDSRYTDGDAESLLSRYTGWTLPFSGLRYWVLGLPQPVGEQQQVTLDQQGRITSIMRPDWYIRFQRYQKVGEVHLPRKIVLENDEIKVRLVFDQWNFNG